MAEFKLGRIRFVWKSSWTTATTYYKDDVVEYGDPGDGKKSRHPIFQRLVDEKKGIVDLIHLEDGVLEKISELQMLCSNLCPKIHSTIPKRAALEELSRKRKIEENRQNDEEQKGY